MNYVKLKGTIRNIQLSHISKSTEYDKADLIVKRNDGEDDVLSLMFKKFTNKYVEDQEVELSGTLRSYTKKLENGKNKVSIYVMTYFDLPDNSDESDASSDNIVELSGVICKTEQLRTTKNGKQNLRFILANNIKVDNEDSKYTISNYIPCTVWGKLAQEMSSMKVSDKIAIKGQLHSRTYKKILENGDVEIRTAHEVIVLDYYITDEV